MAYDPGAIDAALAAAVGDDPVLIAELRLAFTEGATRAFAQMESARSTEDWCAAAWRLKGLAASFGAVRLMALASGAAAGTPHDRSMLAKLKRTVARL